MTKELDFSDFKFNDNDLIDQLPDSLYNGTQFGSGISFRTEAPDDWVTKVTRGPKVDTDHREDPEAPSVTESENNFDQENRSFSTSLWSSHQSLKSPSQGSWDVCLGPVAWEEKDLTFNQLLEYADLMLTEEEENGLLTDRIIASCASYITQSPASKYYIVAKVCLDNKNLNDISIIAHHRFLQYVDLSWNNLTDLSPLGSLPYLMYLDVSHNLLEKVLQFKPPWNLTYVNYSYNEVWQIDDLSDFWSLSYLDLSHNNISKIQGLDSLRYLRHLNLSHNKITRLENLNHSRITDLNLEYNLISAFQTGDDAGLKTMLNLSSLCLNNNLISSLEFLQGGYHIKKLELQGNRITSLIQLGCMKSLRKLRLLDLTGNPVCQYKTYRNLLLNLLPELKFLDQTEVDLSEKVVACLSVTNKIQLEVAKDNARMILLDQLNDSALELDVLPIDQPAYPLVILVGPPASGKTYLVSQIAKKFQDKVFIGKIHTTRDILEWEKAVMMKIGREEFNEKVKSGAFYCVQDYLGYFYGFSKEMVGMAVKEHKLCLTYMNLENALTIRTYGIQPYLVLTIMNSETDHQINLKEKYGPIITMLGASNIAKRELAFTHSNNVRRVQEILLDLIEDVTFIVEGEGTCISRPHYRESFNVQARPTDIGSKLHGAVLSASREQNLARGRVSSHISTREELMNSCSPTVCMLQESYKQTGTQNYDVDHSSESTSNIDEVKDEGSGTCSTSYSAIASPPKVYDIASPDDEDICDGEDDIFFDWSSPFFDWDEINIDPVAMEEASEQLCGKFIERVLDTRNVYQSIHMDNPGLFSHVLLTDDIEEAEKNLVEILKEVWRLVPTLNPLFDVEHDYAYKEMIPKRLERFKGMIRNEIMSGTPDVCATRKISSISSPRQIITQMQLMGYEETAEIV